MTNHNRDLENAMTEGHAHNPDMPSDATDYAKPITQSEASAHTRDQLINAPRDRLTLSYSYWQGDFAINTTGTRHGVRESLELAVRFMIRRHQNVLYGPGARRNDLILKDAYQYWHLQVGLIDADINRAWVRMGKNNARANIQTAINALGKSA